MSKWVRYDEEFKLQASRLVAEQGYTYAQAVERLGASSWSIRQWVKKFRESGQLPPLGQPVPDADELRRLRNQIRQLHMENEILRKSDGVRREREPVKYAWVWEHTGEFPVAPMCRVLSVSRSGYYDWLKRVQSRRDRTRDASDIAHGSHC